MMRCSCKHRSGERPSAPDPEPLIGPCCPAKRSRGARDTMESFQFTTGRVDEARAIGPWGNPIPRILYKVRPKNVSREADTLFYAPKRSGGVARNQKSDLFWPSY